MENWKKFLVIAITFLSWSNISYAENQETLLFPPWDDFCGKYINTEKNRIVTCKCAIAQTPKEIEHAIDIAKTKAKMELAKVVIFTERYKGKVDKREKFEIERGIIENSIPLAYKIFEMKNNEYMVCVVVGIGPKEIGSKEVVKNSSINSRDVEILYEEFKTYKAQQEREKKHQRKD